MKSSQKKYLVDTNVLVGFFNKEDALHERAVLTLTKAENFIITEHVFIETINVITRRAGIANAIKAGKELLEQDLNIIQLSSSEFNETWNLFVKQKKLSFADCANIIIAKASGCEAIATFNESFKGIEGIKVVG